MGSAAGDEMTADTGGWTMTGEDGRHVFEVMWLRDAIARLCMRCGVIGRPRKLYLGMLGRARVISAGPFRPMSCAPLGRMGCPGRALGLLSVIRRTPRTVHGGPGRALRGRCTGGQPVNLSAPLCGVQEGDRVDSTTVRVRDAWREECPDPGAYAAITVHPVSLHGLRGACAVPLEPCPRA